MFIWIKTLKFNRNWISDKPNSFSVTDFEVQVEHKVFPCLQTFITRKLLCVHTTIFFQNETQEVFYNTLVHFNTCSFLCTENV